MGMRGPLPTTWREIIDKLWANTIVNEVTGCYEWQGWCLPTGYGRISWQGKSEYIHRLTYEQTTGEPAEVVRHTCDNPPCWNIYHLLNGSHADNVDDKMAKGRYRIIQTRAMQNYYEIESREIK